MNIYEDIALRTGGNIYIGVVGPVRTGKSTFIKKFMEEMVIPNITDEFSRRRTIDELPQSAAGKTIMTAEPKFIPEQAVSITIEEKIRISVKMIDCVGYIIPSALGYIENDMPRMVMTPWFEKPIPFNMAAEIGTKKVIDEHSTIGIAITSDGSFGEISRNEYVNAEKRIVEELKSLNKPFALILNTADAASEDTIKLASDLQEEYGIPVIPLNCLELTSDDIKEILSRLIFEFPIRSISFDMPGWLAAIDENTPIKKEIYTKAGENAAQISKIKHIKKYCEALPDGKYITGAGLQNGDLGRGNMTVRLDIPHGYYYEILSESTGLKIENDGDIMKNLIAMSKERKTVMSYAQAIKDAEDTGYGIVSPSRESFECEEPEIIKQGGRYGISLKAKANTVHVIRADIETEISPIVGTQEQSQGLINYLNNAENIWDCDIFGRTLCDMVNDGFSSKIGKMPLQARDKFKETLERVINEGTDGLICIII